jgi:hypothetical protein
VVPADCCGNVLVAGSGARQEDAEAESGQMNFSWDLRLPRRAQQKNRRDGGAWLQGEASGNVQPSGNGAALRVGEGVAHPLTQGGTTAHPIHLPIAASINSLLNKANLGSAARNQSYLSNYVIYCIIIKKKVQSTRRKQQLQTFF